MSDQHSKSNLNLLSVLSACGSAASLTALMIVLIDKITSDPQTFIWKLIIVLVCLMFIGGVIVVSYYKVRQINEKKDHSIVKRTVKTLFTVVISLFLLAIFIDGIFAIIYWRWWLQFPLQLVKLF